MNKTLIALFFAVSYFSKNSNKSYFATHFSNTLEYNKNGASIFTKMLYEPSWRKQG